MKRCKELDPIWQAMKEGKKFRHMPTCNNGFIDEIDLHTDRGVVHFMSYGWFSSDEVRPIEPTYRVKDPVSLMQALVDGGYKCDENGNWWCEKKPLFFNSMFQYSGKLTTESPYSYLPKWLEEVYE
jgi:hypothetical protein